MCHAIQSTPHHRMISKTPSVALCPMLVSISDHRGLALATAAPNRSDSSSYTQRRRPARAWPSSPYRCNALLEGTAIVCNVNCNPASATVPQAEAPLPRIAPYVSRHVCKMQYMQLPGIYHVSHQQHSASHPSPSHPQPFGAFASGKFLADNTRTECRHASARADLCSAAKRRAV